MEDPLLQRGDVSRRQRADLRDKKSHKFPQRRMKNFLRRPKLLEKQKVQQLKLGKWQNVFISWLGYLFIAGISFFMCCFC